MTMPRIFRHTGSFKQHHDACVATIGNFDGVHCGHRALLMQLRHKAEQLHLPAVVILFEPHPQEFFSNTPPARLMRFADKCREFVAAGVDAVLCLRFDAALAATSAEDFIHQVLVRDLGVRHLIIGDDFRFGAKRSGDVNLLRASGQFEVSDSATVSIDGQRVSSTLVRASVAAADFASAAKWLGRPFTMSGRVAHGDKRGRQLGFPTANIILKRAVLPLTGVYAVQVTCNNTVLSGVANIGWRPTVDGRQARFEVHLLDFSGDLYGQQLCVQFLEKIREEIKFESLDALRAQIARDVSSGRKLCSQHQHA